MALPETAGAADLRPRPAIDPVGEAARAGAAVAAPAGKSLREALGEADQLLVQARSDGAFRASLAPALDLVRLHPQSEALQTIAAHLLSEDGDSRSPAVWAALHARFPQSPEAFGMLARMTVQQDGLEAGEALLARRFPHPEAVTGESDLLALAYALEELAHPAEAEAILQRVADLFPTSQAAWLRLIHLQEARGGLLGAQHSAAAARSACGSEVFAPLHARLTREIQILQSFTPVGEDDRTPVSLRALQAVLAAVPSRRTGAAPPPRRLGSTLMITGSLGPGGAERQLITTVLSLQRAMRDGRAVGGREIVGPLAVVCRSLAMKHGNDFFLRTLLDEGTRVIEYNRLPAFGGARRFSRVGSFAPLLEFLPPRLREGLALLADLIRYEAPQVVQIWQDGMVFAAGLAALLADTPRIVLSVRSLPPTDRVNRWRIELEPIYRTLLAAPGVVLTANSTYAARRYEDWLGMSRGVVPVVHNGVERLDETAGQGEERLWADFARRTADADFTLGAVMRLDSNKRPLEWLAFAESLWAMRKSARFIVVGDGELKRECVEYAARLGFSDRILFTGRTASVGYWLAKMDALMLLSRFEGMPNALIEAQLAGVPVVTTPAGGAPETLLAGRTGFVLSDAERPSVEQARTALLGLAQMSPDRRRAMGGAARAWAEQSFSVEAMVARTLDVFMASWDEPMLPGRPF